MIPDAKKKQGKNGEKQHAGLLYSMGCSKTATQKKDGYCCNSQKNFDNFSAQCNRNWLL